MGKKVVLCVSLVLLILLPGCWSRTELNELSIVTALAIDKIEDRYKITAQVIDVDEIAGMAQSNRAAVSTYELEGKSVFETIRMLTKLASKKLYLAHLRVVVINEELAKEGMEATIDFLTRDHEVRTDFYLVVSKEKDANVILNILTPIEKIPAAKIFNSIEVSERFWAPTRGVRLDMFVSKMLAKGENPVLTGVFVKGDLSKAGNLQNVETIPSPAMIELGHLAAFNGDQLVGWLTEDESKGYNYLTDNVNSTVGVMECKGGNITLEIFGSKTEVKAMTQNNRPKIIVEVKSEAAVGEVQCENGLIDEERIRQLEKEGEQRLVHLLNESINKAKQLKTDIFGFGDSIHRNDPKLWRNVREDWNENGFVNLEVEIKAQLKIRRTGTIEKPFQRKTEEE